MLLEAAMRAPNQRLIVTWTTGAFANLALNLALSIRKNVRFPARRKVINLEDLLKHC